MVRLDRIEYSYNFISDSICDKLIEIFQKYYESETWRGSKVLRTDYDNITDSKDLDYIKKISSDLNVYIRKIDNNAFIDYFPIVEWPTNSQMDLHYDRDDQAYTSIIYLNDNFTGGETAVKIKDTFLNIRPKKGLICTFNGNICEHYVTKITSGTRYTLPVWFKTLGL
jgi:hypothetical protein